MVTGRGPGCSWGRPTPWPGAAGGVEGGGAFDEAGQLDFQDGSESGSSGCCGWSGNWRMVASQIQPRAACEDRLQQTYAMALL